jgi:hypothetical protein
MKNWEASLLPARSRESWHAALGDENVCGFDVSVDDPFRVCGIEGVGNLDRQAEQNFCLGRSPCDAIFQGYALEKLHRDEGLLAALADVINRAHPAEIDR